MAAMFWLSFLAKPKRQRVSPSIFQSSPACAASSHLSFAWLPVDVSTSFSGKAPSEKNGLPLRSLRAQGVKVAARPSKLRLSLHTRSVLKNGLGMRPPETDSQSHGWTLAYARSSTSVYLLKSLPSV